MAEVVWTEPALHDLQAIADYIALEDSQAARGLVQRVFRHVEQLVSSPRARHLRGGTFCRAAVLINDSDFIRCEAIHALAPNRNAGYCRSMPSVALQAHYDGHRIVLDEPYDLPANASLLVTVLSSSLDADSEEVWLRAVSANDAFAFLADPAEDIYTRADGEPFRDAV